MANIAQLLTEHIDIWTAAETEKKLGRGRASGNAGSVYGVKKLRELILELAVRGKLVPQDLNDEPASELLKRIQAEKAKLVTEGKLKKEKPLAPIADDKKPFELPRGWEFVRLETISDINGGFAFKSTSYTEHGVRVIRISDFDEKGFKDDKIVRYKYSSDLEQYKLAPNNILMAMTGGTVGKCYLVKDLAEDMVVNQRVATIKLISLVLPEYISSVLQTSSVQSVIQEAKNSTNDNISMLDIKEFFIPIPSLTEQQRIVTKVDELMALCDQLEQQYSNAQEAHETLVSQLLATLTQSQNAAEFNANWQRIYAHFDVLFTTEASIDALKQTLLQLAILGKLVPQDPNDEPASELLKLIQAEKAKLIVEGKLKKEKPLAAISEDEKPFELPSGWEWVRLADLLAMVTDGDHQAPPKSDSGVPFLVIGNLNTGNISIENCRFVSEKYFEGLDWIKKPQVDDLLYTVTGSYGIPIKVVNEQPFCVQRHVAILKSTKFTPINYLMYLLKSKYALEYAAEIATGIAQKTVPLSGLRMMPIPIASILEQNRIVAKVDALMSLCDQLKTRIQQASQQQQTIANALVTQALQPASAEIINLADYRNAVGCYIVNRMCNQKTFGTTQAMKLFYLAEAHIGLQGLMLQPERKQAGPFYKWIYEFEKIGQSAKWFSVNTKVLTNGNPKVEYTTLPNIAQPLKLIEQICTPQQLKELDRLFSLFAGKNTEEAEIIATLFAVWNDFLIDGHTPSDDEIVKEVRENWHESKTRFTPAQLKENLNWMRRNDLVPQGRLPHTVYQQQLLN
jgi:type I restriction enzyme S subunit